MTPVPPARGDELAGRYRLERPLNDDGVVERWAAVDHVLARRVEVEVLAPTAAAAERDAFVAAATAVARLSHPSVLSAYDRGVTSDGLPFLVTERAVGPTLADLIARQGPLPAERVAVLGSQVAHALDAAHRHGTVHGAVGAGAVQVSEDDHAKLAGFTDAAVRARAAGASPSPRDDVDACARMLAEALIGAVRPSPPSGEALSPRAAGRGVPPSLDRLLVAAQHGGPVTTAADLAAQLGALALDDDAQSILDPRPTPQVPTPEVSTPPRSGGGRSGAVAGIVVGLLLAAGVGVAAFILFNQGGSPSTPGPTSSPRGTVTLAPKGAQYTITAAQSFDPFGDHTEQQQLAGNLFDGNAASVWSTEEYTTARFGGLKPGVGIFVVLDATHQLHQLVVQSPSRGWAFSVYVADRPSDTLAGWGRTVASAVVSNGLTAVDLRGVSGSAVLVWVTDLGPPLANPPQPSTPYRVDVGEVQLS